MELKAENSFTVTKELYMEGLNRLNREDLMPMVRKLLIFLGVLWLALAAFTIWKGVSPIAVIFELLALVVLGLWVGVLNPRSRAKKGWQAMENKFGGQMERHTRFYEDRLEVDAGGKTLIVNYEDIVRVLDTPHMMVLMSKEKQGIMVHLEGFTLGSKESVLKLIDDWKV